MIPNKVSYRRFVQRSVSVYDLYVENINQQLKRSVEMQLDDVEYDVITSLQGLKGKAAKMKMFQFFIDNGLSTYDELATAFPSYQIHPVK
jgi:hypothetical protein